MSAIRAAEIVVVGGGPGGLSAALAAASAGARVTILDAYTEPGGQYYHQPPAWRRHKATRRQRHGKVLWRQVEAAGVEIRTETLIWNADSQRVLSYTSPAGPGEIQPQALILSTGAYEQPAVFPGWNLPGVITAGAAQILLYHRVRPGQRVLLAGTGPLQLLTAANLLRAGVKVVAVVEGAEILPGAIPHPGAMWGQWERAWEGLTSLAVLLRQRTVYRTGWGIVAARGREQVEGATIARLDENWGPIPGTEETVACDTICNGYGLTPFNSLAKLAGAVQVWRPDLGGEVPIRDAHFQTTVPGIYAVGDGAGIGGYRMAMLEGQIAGLCAAAGLGYGREAVDPAVRKMQPALSRERAFQRLYTALFTPGPGIYTLAAPDTLVCRCEGVTQVRLEQAVLQGAATMGEVKALTRCGMGECQGRMCGRQVMQTIARLTGQSAAQVGTYAVRPPLFPLPIGALSGPLDLANK